MHTLQDLFVHELADLHDTEHQFTKSSSMRQTADAQADSSLEVLADKAKKI